MSLHQMFGLVVIVAVAADESCVAQTKLELKFQEGATTRDEMLESVQIDVIPPGEKKVYTTTINQRWYLDSRIVKTVDDASAEFRQKFSRIALTIQLPPPVNRMFTVDTGRPQASEEKVEQDMRFGIAKVIGLEWSVTLDRRGEVRDVGLSDELTDVLIQNPQTGPLKDTFSDTGLRKLAEQSTVLLPDRPIKKGDHWEQTIVRPMAEGKLTLVRKCTSQGVVEDGLEKIAVKSQFTFENGKNAKRPLTLTDSSGDGEVFFDAKAGRVVRSKFTQTLVFKDANEKPGTQVVKTVNVLLPPEREATEKPKAGEESEAKPSE